MKHCYYSGKTDVQQALQKEIPSDRVSIHVSETASSCQEGGAICGVALSSNCAEGHLALLEFLESSLYSVPFGLATSVFDVTTSTFEQDMERVSAPKKGANATAIEFSRIVQKEGGDPVHAMSHVGRFETLLPTNCATGAQKRLGLVIRSYSLEANEECMHAIAAAKKVCEKSLRATATEKLEEEEEEGQAVDPVSVHADLSVCEAVEAVATASSAALAASLLQQERIAFGLAHELNLGVASTAKVVKRKLYPSYMTPNNSCVYTANDEGRATFTCYFGATSESREPGTGTTVCLFHSPTDGSMVYSMKPDSFAPQSDHFSDKTGLYATSCDRITMQSQTNDIKENTGVAQDPLGMGNQHYCSDAQSGSYRPLLTCPSLYSRAFYTEGELLRVRADLTLFGYPVSYQAAPPIVTPKDVRSFLDTLTDKESRQEIFVPDKNGSVSALVTGAYPDTFFTILTKENAVVSEEDGSLRGWLLTSDVLSKIAPSSSE